MSNQRTYLSTFLAFVVASLFLSSVEQSSAAVRLQLGGLGSSSTRVVASSASSSRQRYGCHWDCHLVSCKKARQDDECAYDCDKVCRFRLGGSIDDYAGRSDSPAAHQLDGAKLEPKSAASDATAGGQEVAPTTTTTSGDSLASIEAEVGQSVRLLLPRQAGQQQQQRATFSILERCSPLDEAASLSATTSETVSDQTEG